MKKPIEIINLEKEINRGEALQVGLRNINDYFATNDFSFSINKEGEVNGLCISGDKLMTSPDLSAFTHLAVLSLNNNQLTDVSSLSSLTQLTGLSLSSNERHLFVRFKFIP